MNRLKAFAIVIFLMAFLTVGCPDPSKRADELMAKQGVNRLRRPNDYIQPGGIITVDNGRAIYSDNMFDYVEVKNPEGSYPIFPGNEKFPSMTDEKSMSADIALNFLDSFLPVKISNKISLTANVKIQGADAKTRRLKVPDINRFMKRREGVEFNKEMAAKIRGGKKVFIVYQTLSANKFSLVADAGHDIAASAKIGEIKPLFEGAEPKFSWKKTSATGIEIEGDTFYVFAVKVGRLSCDETLICSIDETDFPKLGVLGGEEDNKYVNTIFGNINKVAGVTVMDFPSIELEP